MEYKYENLNLKILSVTQLVPNFYHTITFYTLMAY